MPDRAELQAVYIENAMLIKAAEQWGAAYKKDPTTHAGIIRHETRLEIILRRFYRTMADKAHTFINWDFYHHAIHAYDVNVIVYDDALDEYNGVFMQVTFDEVLAITALGAQAGETIYKRPIGLTNATDVLQQTARKQIAQLVGKKILPDGSIVDNPNADYRITDEARKNIRESIRTSISLGENRDQAIERLRSDIKTFGRKRAEMIAQTESVNAYSRGLQVFGKQSGAVGKEWQTVGADDICAVYQSYGAVPFNFLYDGKHGPAAHPRCRCGLRLIYQNELDDNPNLLNNP